MEQFKIVGTDNTPSICIDFSTCVVTIEGEAYSGEAADALKQVEDKLDILAGNEACTDLTVNLNFLYFNSSSARRVMHMLLKLDEIADDKTVNINWGVRDSDESMQEMGEEYGEDIENANFRIVPL